MRRYLSLLLIAGLLLYGCNINPGSRQKNIGSGNSGNINESSTAQTNDDKSQSTQNTEDDLDTADSSTPDSVNYKDASVEILVKTGKSFISAAFNDDIHGMTSLCDDALCRKIDNNRLLYIGTKPNYVVEKIDITIKPADEEGKYILNAAVDTLKKSDKKEYTFKYSIQIEKNNLKYYVTDFKTI